jgi:diguanylate cyclase (GGDEF)-like protein
VLSALTKTIAMSINTLHNRDASALAKKTITLIESQAGKTQIDLLKQAWENFITVYDDSFLQKLSHFGEVDSRNLQKTIEGLSVDAHSTQKGDLTRIAQFLVMGLSPSIAPKLDDKTSALTQKLQDDPDCISHDEFEKEIKAAIAMRIALDKQSVEEMVKALDELLGKLSTQLIDLIERSESSSTEIRDVKRDLEALESDKPKDFKTAHKRLYAIATTLEEKVKILSHDLRTHNAKVTEMGQKIAMLESQLVVATQASKEDFLTKLLNKRALEEIIEIKEAEYIRYGRNYCLAMLDLDFFKSVNDTYGHEAGDAVLKAFANIFKDEARVNDTVGRFGGEEFLAVLGDTDLTGAKIFGEKVRAHVEEAQFLYQGQRIAVTVSIGIAQRKDYPSVETLKVGADERLYDAKHKGRNRVAV